MTWKLWWSHQIGIWWRHQMEIFSALLALCEENLPVPGGFPSQRPLARSFDDYFELRLNNGCANSRVAGDLRRHCFHYDVTVMSKKYWPSAEFPCWRHAMETLSLLLSPCDGNPLVTCGFSSNGSVMRSFTVPLMWARIRCWTNRQFTSVLRRHATHVTSL